MEEEYSGARRRTASIPAKPETGLAEWTSRIKAMQKQVDDDEEAETRRLEQEIAASRLARMRRSTGRGTSSDLSNSDIAKSLKDTEPATSPINTDNATSPGDKQRSQEDTLRKLMGESQARRPESASSGSVAQPMSLAAFMGGRAAGPRLNKHAPQQDSHDPTQFEQRTITAPHPVFGRGGVAMPGMAAKTRARNGDNAASNSRSPSAPGKGLSPVPSSNAPSAAKTNEQSAEVRRTPILEKPNPNSPANDWQTARQRTLSTPSSAIERLSPAPVPEPPIAKPYPSPRPLSQNPVSGDYLSAKPTASSGRHTPTSQTPRSTPSRTQSVSPLPSTPPSRQTYNSSPSIASPKSPTVSSTPGLAKPILPTPKFQGPQIPLGQNSSPAFLRTPPAKDPTPSISRLQGRGFVQNMVRASTHVGTPTPPGGPSTHGTPEKDKDTSRKASVLDRWQFNNSPAPIIAPKPVPLKKSRTVDSSGVPASTSPVPTPFNPNAAMRDKPEKALRSVPSLPSMASTAASDRIPRPASAKNDGSPASPPVSQKRGLGSSTTMISYIKPLKTGDNPPTNNPPSRPSSRASRSRPTTPSREVDEMGLRVRSRSRPRSVGFAENVEEIRPGSSAAGAAGKPLSHPTKERAKKPKRAKTTFAGSSLKSSSSVSDDMLAENKGQTSVHATPVAHAPPRAISPRSSVTSETTVAHTSEPAAADKSRESTPSPPPPGASRRVHFPLEVEPVSAPQDHEKPRSPVTPIRHTRIPSTGNRATVMDVAQALSQFEEHSRKGTNGEPYTSKAQEQPVDASEPPEAVQRPDVKTMVSGWGAGNGGAAPSLIASDKRKSSYEKYSAFALPPLVEEKTPAPSPVNSLARRSGSAAGLKAEGATSGGLSESGPEPVTGSQFVPSTTRPALVPTIEAEPASKPTDPYIHFEHVDEPLPKADIVPLLNFKPSAYKPNPDSMPISVDVMIISGSTATSVNTDSHVFYDMETLAIIHRFKTKSNGLVNTKVWAWRGSKAHAGEREEAKLQELARRYNTSLIHVRQSAEPAEMVYVLGGRVATRQGTRSHWSRENTAMHLVRSNDGVIYIDELELSIRNLCSGFSYCLSLLETFYVWHGSGALPEERQAALEYARSLAADPANIVELTEGSGDDDEMFWIILGEGEYARAEYWKWKPSFGTLGVKSWLVDSDASSKSLARRVSIGVDSDVNDHVYLLDCVLEYFVLIGSEARGKRRDIRLAVHIAKQLAAATAPSRPFHPTVHALILPSQLPADLRLTFRELDEVKLNRGAVPDHMNLLSSIEAVEHLERTSWEKSLLTDDSMLPLGLQHGH